MAAVSLKATRRKVAAKHKSASAAVAIETQRQQRKDEYYMRVAEAVRTAANCLGSRVGAVLVLQDRIISTGYNGTPAGFPNCSDGGCVRCSDSRHIKEGHPHLATDPEHISGKALDRCICVHAEQNTVLTAARFGISVDGACLYTTLSPCFGCLKEAAQAGVKRIIYGEMYPAKYSEALMKQYEELALHLTEGDREDFRPLTPDPPIATSAQPDPYEDEGETPRRLEF